MKHLKKFESWFSNRLKSKFDDTKEPNKDLIFKHLDDLNLEKVEGETQIYFLNPENADFALIKLGIEDKRLFVDLNLARTLNTKFELDGLYESACIVGKWLEKKGFSVIYTQSYIKVGEAISLD